MTTSNIQVYDDVKARLEEERKNEKESFNDILRRLLDMNEPEVREKHIPHWYEGIIKINNFNNVQQDVLDIIINDPDWDGSFSNYIEINGISMLACVSQPLTLELKAETDLKIIESMKKVLGEDKFNEYMKQNKIKIDGYVQLDCKTGKPLEKATYNWEGINNE